MLGNALFRFLFQQSSNKVYGSVRSPLTKSMFSAEFIPFIYSNIAIENDDSLHELFASIRPELVINCIGLVKQLDEANNPLCALPINALFPHRLSKLCSLIEARLIHVSTDCVFSGLKGDYSENDFADSNDLYGRSKYLGELNEKHNITFRTSLIGHELNSSHSLINWFLSQETPVLGYRKAVFSGLPTCEFARIIRDFVLPATELHGLYHVGSSPISKHDLLTLVNQQYQRNIDIYPDDSVEIDRSLNSQLFHKATGYKAPSWQEMIKDMHAFN